MSQRFRAGDSRHVACCHDGPVPERTSEDLLQAARARYVEGGEYFLPERFHPLEVRADGAGVLLIFRWSNNPNRFALRIAADPGVPIPELLGGFEEYWDEWLDTGLVYWGDKVFHADVMGCGRSADGADRAGHGR
jgi:hypothetical protein